MQKFIKILSVILIISLVCVFFAGCKDKDVNPGGENPETTTINLADGGEENIDGTPVEVEPYETETGEPYVNNEGYPVYHVKNTYDEKGEPVLVVKTLSVDDNGKVIFKLQTVENGVIKDASTEETPEVTTVFAGNSDNIPPATNSGEDNSEDNTSSNPSNTDPTASNKDSESQQGGTNGDTTVEPSKDLGETIKLGGVWGNVTRHKGNIYRGTLVEKELQTLKEPEKYSGINAEFTRGIYIPDTITAEDGKVYTVKQVAYTRLYVYFDTWEQDYDWFTERGIFKPGMPEDPLVYIEDNESFELEPEFRDVHTVYLIELA